MAMKALATIVAFHVGVVSTIAFSSLLHNQRTLTSRLSQPKIRSRTLHAILVSDSVDKVISIIESENLNLRRPNATIESEIDSWINWNSFLYQFSSQAKDDPLLIGNYNVSYTSIGNRQKNNGGEPAGGGYRSAFGGLFFEVKDLFQNILREADGQLRAVNMVHGRLLGLIPFYVVLYGVARLLTQEHRDNLLRKFGSAMSPSAVQAKFEPPLLCFGNPRSPLSLALRVGVPSSVVLDTPYVCSKVRLGIGSRGSKFIFVRTASKLADEWRLWRNRQAVSTRSLGLALAAVGVAFGLPLGWPIRWTFGRVVSVITVGLGIFLAKNRGGIENYNTEDGSM